MSSRPTTQPEVAVMGPVTVPKMDDSDRFLADFLEVASQAPPSQAPPSPSQVVRKEEIKQKYLKLINELLKEKEIKEFYSNPQNWRDATKAKDVTADTILNERKYMTLHEPESMIELITNYSREMAATVKRSEPSKKSM